MTLLVDVCLTPEWVAFLKFHAIPAVHWSSVGPVDVDDQMIFEYALEHECVVFTHDLDFGTLLAHAGTNKPSVIQARVDDVAPHFLGPTLVTAWHQFSEQLERGAILTILPDRMKVRILPI